MAMRAAAPLLALLGHELRAPAGVIGGYLALIDRGTDRLSPEQQQALAGARRAQQRLVEVLDDASRLLTTWKAEDGAPAALSLSDVLECTRVTALAQSLPLLVDMRHDVAVRVASSRVALAEALVAVAAAVAREHGADVTLTTTVTGAEAAVCHLRPVGGRDPVADDATREPFNLWRPGLGLRLVVAATVLVDAGLRLDDVLVQGTRTGVDITFATAG